MKAGWLKNGTIKNAGRLKNLGRRLGMWLLAAMAAVVTWSGCATSQERAERQAQLQAAVNELMGGRHWRIRITTMHSARYGVRRMSDGYCLEVKGDTLVSYLPYVGRVYHSGFYSSNGLDFEAPIRSYRVSRPKDKFFRAEVQVKLLDEVFDYVVDVYDSGQAQIRVRSLGREAVSFDGDCELE